MKILDDLPEALATSGAVDITRRLAILEGGHVLDLATGRGDFIETMMTHLDSYRAFTGIDIDVDKLGEARERFEGSPVDLIEMDADHMSFEDATFDTVCISYSLHHLKRPDDVMDEMVRVLRPGGLFLLQEMFCDGNQTPAQRTDATKHHWMAWADTLTGTYHRETYTRHEIRSTVRRLALHDVGFIETAYEVKCLTCQEWSKCADPKHQEIVQNAIDEVEKDLARLEGCCDDDTRGALKRKGLAIIEMVRETGVSPASTMFVIGRK